MIWSKQSNLTCHKTKQTTWGTRKPDHLLLVRQRWLARITKEILARKESSLWRSEDEDMSSWRDRFFLEIIIFNNPSWSMNIPRVSIHEVLDMYTYNHYFLHLCWLSLITGAQPLQQKSGARNIASRQWRSLAVNLGHLHQTPGELMGWKTWSQ